MTMNHMVIDSGWRRGGLGYAPHMGSTVRLGVAFLLGVGGWGVPLGGLGSPACAEAAPPGPEPFPPDSVRVVDLTVVTDPAFRRDSAWQPMVRSVVERAGRDLAAGAGLAFRPAEEIEWTPPERAATLAEVLDRAVEAVGPRDGLTVVLLGRAPRGLSDPEEHGYAYLGYPSLVIVAPERSGFGEAMKRQLAQLLRHELGHVFGLPHTREKTVMYPRLDGRQDRFGELELLALRATRNMDFAAGVPFAGCDLEMLRDVYGLMDERGELDTALLVNLGAAFHRERKPEAARAVFERALGHESHSTAGRLGLAQSVAATGDTALAESLAVALTAERDLTPEMRGVLGSLWLGLGATARAESLLSLAVDAGLPRFSFWFNRGLARFRQGRYTEARPDFQAALRVEERPEGWFNLGLTCDALKLGDEATRAFTRYLELVPEGVQAEQARAFVTRWAR